MKHIGLLLVIFISSTTFAISSANPLQSERERFLDFIIKVHLQKDHTRSKGISQSQSIITSKKTRSSGGISGTVIGLDERALANAYVQAFTIDSTLIGQEGSKGIGEIAKDGSYRIGRLLPGSYYVFVRAEGYKPNFYDNVESLEQATQVKVEENTFTENINFSMEKIVPGQGVITGTIVNREDDHPLGDVHVRAFTNESPYQYGDTVTESNGHFTISGLKTGHYYVSAWIDGYLQMFYPDVNTLNDAEQVYVTEPDTTKGIDFFMTKGGSITGRILTKDNKPLAGVYVEAMNAFRDSLGDDETGSIDPGMLIGYGKAVSDEDGFYKITGLPDGEYFVHVTYKSEWTYTNIWYENATTPFGAVAVPVVVGQETGGIDFHISVSTPSGMISGRVTDLDGEPVQDAYMQIQSLGETSFSPYVWKHTRTDKKGHYLFANLPDGEYLLYVWAKSGWQSVHRWWPDSETRNQANVITINQGVEPKTYDFELPINIGTCTIAGTVTTDDGIPVMGANVQIRPADSTDPATGNTQGVWAYGSTDSIGNYEITALPPGSYIVHVSHWEGEKFGEQWYQGAETLESADIIVLEENQSRKDIHFSLTLLPIFGDLIGNVFDKESNQPVHRAYVKIEPVSSHRDYFLGPFYFGGYHATTNEKGEFRIGNLYRGKYLISVYTQGGFEYYKDVIVSEQATPVEIKGGEKTLVAIHTEKRNDGPGIITGKVNMNWDSPPEIAVVTAKPAVTIMLWPQSELFYTAVTQKDGSYELSGLPPGEYYVQSFAPWTIAQYYDQSYNPSEATLVKVDGETPTMGIDFTLQPIRCLTEGDGRQLAPSSSAITGIVNNEQGDPIGDALIYIFDESGQPVSYTQSTADGSFEISGLPPGQYVLQVGKIGYETQYNGNAASFALATPIQLGNERITLSFQLVGNKTTGVNKEPKQQTPDSIELFGNYPNPFNPTTRITFSIPSQMKAVLGVYNINGKKVIELVHGPIEPGIHNLEWDGRDASGRRVSSGLYIYRLHTEKKVLTGKMLLIK